MDTAQADMDKRVMALTNPETTVTADPTISHATRPSPYVELHSITEGPVCVASWLGQCAAFRISEHLVQTFIDGSDIGIPSLFTKQKRTEDGDMKFSGLFSMHFEDASETTLRLTCKGPRYSLQVKPTVSWLPSQLPSGHGSTRGESHPDTSRHLHCSDARHVEACFATRGTSLARESGGN